MNKTTELQQGLVFYCIVLSPHFAALVVEETKWALSSALVRETKCELSSIRKRLNSKSGFARAQFKSVSCASSGHRVRRVLKR